MRTVKVFNRTEGVWQDRDFNELKRNDIFRLYDDGKRYTNQKTGDNVWIASGSPCVENGFPGIKTLY